MIRELAREAQPRTATRWLATTGVGLGVAAALLALSAAVAFGAQGGSGTLTDVANDFKLASGGWISTALGYARHLFFALVAIELAWTAITYALQRDNLSDFAASVVLKLMGVFFFLALLQNAPAWIPYIVDSFSQAGAAIGGQATVLDPSATFGQGLQLAKNMLGTLNDPAFFTAVVAVLLAVFCAIGVVIAYAVVAGQLMVTLIESYIVISAGLFFLGFSGSRWTLPFSEKYVAYAVSVGIKLFMLYLVVGLGQTLAAQWQVLFTPGHIAPPDVYIGVAGSALVFMLLGWQIPNLAASLMNGSPAMTLGAAANMAGTTVAAGTAVVGGSLAAAGVVGAAGVGVASALTARTADLQQLERVNRASSPSPIGVIAGKPEDLGPERFAHDSTPVSGARAQLEPTPSIAASDGESSGQPPAAAASSAEGAPTNEEATGAASSRGGSWLNANGGVPGALPDDHPGAQSMDDIARQLAVQRRSQQGAPSSQLLRSIRDMLRGIRIPSFPHDAASGSIHIRFKHHDAD